MATECKEFHPYPYQQFCIQHIIDHPSPAFSWTWAWEKP